jgi:hypothetical protein
MGAQGLRRRRIIADEEQPFLGTFALEHALTMVGASGGLEGQRHPFAVPFGPATRRDLTAIVATVASAAGDARRSPPRVRAMIRGAADPPAGSTGERSPGAVARAAPAARQR